MDGNVPLVHHPVTIMTFVHKYQPISSPPGCHMRFCFVYVQYPNKETQANTNTPCAPNTRARLQIQKEAHLAGRPTTGLRSDLHVQTQGPSARSDLQSGTKHTDERARSACSRTHSHKQTNARTHPLAHSHAHTLQLIGRQVSGEEEKVPVQHIQAEYAISSS